MLNKRIFTAKEVRDNEALAAKNSHCELFTLMQRAGEAVFSAWKEFNAEHTLVIVGQGNNAGDGYITASLIKQSGKLVTLCAVNPEQALTGDAAKAYKLWRDEGGEINAYSSELLNRSDLIIDAMLGTGIKSSVRDNFAKIINQINACNKPVLSIDVPSGISADSGQPLGIAIQASKTITFVGIKQGLTTATGKQHCGQLIFDDLNIGPAFFELATSSGTLININSFKKLGARSLNSHKGTHGKLLCVGGNEGTAGAIRLTSEAALRAGAGMVRVYTHSSSIAPVSIGRPELMVGSANLQQALEWASSVVIGPGLGQDEWAQQTFDEVMQYCQNNNTPLVIDADALNLLAKQASSYMLKQCVLTPHPGEASRLLSVSTSNIESDRFNYARLCAKRYNATCVLKGAGTLIDNASHTWVCENGNAALAVGGSGDVLTGIIGGLFAQGLDMDEAARYGVTLHAKAGEIASECEGQRGMLPSDLFKIVRSLIN
ncbi:NAD(P)H-hydrate dehydratase [Pseudoalteromonas sp. MMG007]|uniref:NAD(P)H-hydrate dehydratase n=1 Tax=Pseudoalteromonas sp. MMG007 TaxID=2822684 RepID=UPI001B3654FB|nr:NAD(P)H-hydrate dehydratase [Pseudoalteromonas sp. MMG007]MBQ4860031.1 NAD(P)H-hydrate dehydratase [Pseudoalteromonas sp. MMG007]